MQLVNATAKYASVLLHSFPGCIVPSLSSNECAGLYFLMYVIVICLI